MKKNFRVTLEFPRVVVTRNGNEMTVDRIQQYIYGRANAESALRKFGSTENLANLRKQGFRMTRAEFKEFRKDICIEEI